MERIWPLPTINSTAIYFKNIKKNVKTVCKHESYDDTQSHQIRHKFLPNSLYQQRLVTSQPHTRLHIPYMHFPKKGKRWTVVFHIRGSVHRELSWRVIKLKNYYYYYYYYYYTIYMSPVTGISSWYFS